MTNNNRSEISLDTSYLPCGFAYISRHSHQTLFQVLTLADIVHCWLLSPPCTFSGIQIIRHSAYRFLHFLRLLAAFSLGDVSRHIQPTFLAVICWIRFIYCWLARRLPSHVTLVLLQYFCVTGDGKTLREVTVEIVLISPRHKIYLDAKSWLISVWFYSVLVCTILRKVRELRPVDVVISIWYLFIKFLVKKCLSLSFESMKSKFTRVGPLGHFFRPLHGKIHLTPMLDAGMCCNHYQWNVNVIK